MKKQLDLEAMKEAEKKATPGPWGLIDTGQSDYPRPALILANFLRILVDKAENFSHPKDDAFFIAQSRTFVPRAISEIKRLREAVENANKLFGSISMSESFEDIQSLAQEGMEIRRALEGEGE